MSEETAAPQAYLIPDNLIEVTQNFRAGPDSRLFSAREQYCYTSTYEKEVYCGPCGNKKLQSIVFYVVVINGVEYHMQSDYVSPTRVVIPPEEQRSAVDIMVDRVRTIEGEEVYQPTVNLDRFNKVLPLVDFRTDTSKPVIGPAAGALNQGV